MGDFAEYNEHTEDLTAWLLERLAEDEALARAMPHSRLLAAVLSAGSIRDAINGYRRAVQRAVASRGAVRAFWIRLARYEAFTLRIIAGRYADRAGFDRSWLHPPRRQGRPQ